MSESVVVIGGTSGIGRGVAAHYADRGCEVALSSRDIDRAKTVADEVGGRARGIELDLSDPEQIAAQLAEVERVDHLVLAAIERDNNSVRQYDLAEATRLTTLKLVGYTEVVHALADRLGDDSSIVLLGGLAMKRPYPGSTTVTTVNGGISGLTRTMAVELAPVRVNALHPSMVGDTPFWTAKPAHVLEGAVSRVPTGRLVSTDDVVSAVAFLLENPSMNGQNLEIDGGARLA